jgi:hypothetical protein
MSEHLHQSAGAFACLVLSFQPTEVPQILTVMQ